MKACGVFALLIVSILVLVPSRLALRSEEFRPKLDSTAPPLYLPSASKVKLITLGFNNFVSDIIWFNTINYFGKHFASDRDFRWLGQMCDLVTSLDPLVEEEYEFCSTLLSWMAKDPEMAHKLLTRAIDAKPNRWRYYYLRGFTRWYFLNDLEAAKDDFSFAARLPEAPPFVAAIAGRMMVAEQSPDTAIQFLEDMIKNSSDKSAQKALRGKLRLAYTSRDIRILKDLMIRYEQRFGKKPVSFQELVDSQMLKTRPLDPYGKPYRLDPETGEITNSKGKKGLEFFGRTAETGLAKQGI